jgi:hypothetical protein
MLSDTATAKQALGADASLDEGEPKMTTDFRRIYANLLDQWLNCPSEQVLGTKFEHLSLL